MTEKKDNLTGDEAGVESYEDTPAQPPTDKEAPEDVKDPDDPRVIREEGPVGAPHWQAWNDLHRILPCEVLPVNTDDWKVAVDVVEDAYSDQLVIVCKNGERLYQRDAHDPILCRTSSDKAERLR